MIAALLATAENEIDAHDVVAAMVVFLIAALLAAGVYFGGRQAGRPDWGGAGAVFVLIVGAIFALLVAT